MAYQGLRIARDILFRAFWLSFAVMMIFWLMLMYGRDIWVNVAVGQWHLVRSEEALIELAVLWYAILKFYVFFILLIPGLAIHWTLKQMDKTTA